MQLVLADDQYRDHLLPFTFTRPVAELRTGVLTVRRKWEIVLDQPEGSAVYLTRAYLCGKFSAGNHSEGLYINGALLPDEDVLKAIAALKPNQQLLWHDRVMAAILHRDKLSELDFLQPQEGVDTLHYQGTPSMLTHPWDIFTKNDSALRADFNLITRNRRSAPISATNQTVNPGAIFLEPGAKVECAILNASTGPIYIGKDAEVMEGAMIRGPFALGEQAVIKMGAKIYGATTIGPGSKVGGEVSNSVIIGNSNKAHDGFLGNSVLGEWCNLGADTNNSNLKNNYSEVKVWNYKQRDFIATGLTFCGLFMGDHSKCSINTMFNTGTMAGVFANVFGSGFPPKYIPSFSWGGDNGAELFIIDKALSLAEKVMARRNQPFTEADRHILSHLYMQQLRPAGDE